MADSYLGELKLVSFAFAPRGWAFCNGQLLPINQNQPLFALLGTNFGGDGRVNFALPDLRGRAPQHTAGFSPGERGGQEAVTLSPQSLPQHTHALSGTSDFANASVPGGATPAARPRGGINRYAPAGAGASVMGSSSLAPAGGGVA
ncbi:MAG: phage tail protein, partial [Rubrivivax sp.]